MGHKLVYDNLPFLIYVMYKILLMLSCFVAFKAMGKLILEVGLMVAFHCDRYGKVSFVIVLIQLIRTVLFSGPILFSIASFFLHRHYLPGQENK